MAEELEKVGIGKRLIDNKLTLIQQKELKKTVRFIVPEGMISDEDKERWINPMPGGILRYIPNSVFVIPEIKK